MPANRGPTVNKRQRERARDEKRKKKVEKKLYRAAQKAARDSLGAADDIPLGTHELPHGGD